MQFDRDSLMELAEQFEKKAEEFLEVAERIRNAASLFVEQKSEVPVIEEEPVEEVNVTHVDMDVTRLEMAVIESLNNRIAGREIPSIVNYCQHNIGMGTVNSIRLSCRKLTNRGILRRLHRGRYALPEETQEKLNRGADYRSTNNSASAV